MFLGQALDLISLKVPQQFFGKKVSHRSVCSPCATGCQSLKISKVCQNFGKFRQSWNKFIEPFLGKKIILKKFSIFKIEVWLTCKKTAKRPEHLAQSLNNYNKIKLFKNINFFSPKVSSVQRECRFDKSAAFFSLDVREVFTKLRKYLRKVTIRRRPLSAKVSPRQVKSNFVEPEQKTLPISKIISLKAKSHHKKS